MWIKANERLPKPNYIKPVKEYGGKYKTSTYRPGNPQSERYWNEKVEFWLDESIPTIPLSSVTPLVEAAQELINAMFWTYKSRNGKDVSIEDASGEKCWIVPDENIEQLKYCIEALQQFKQKHGI